MQLIIKNGEVIATHTNSQDVAGLYPGSECIQWEELLPEQGPFDLPLLDPRSKEEKKNAYLDKRRIAYPPVSEQLDMIYHDAVNETTVWVDAITAVKNAHPKPAKE